MWVGVSAVGLAVGCPARVGDSADSVKILALDVVFQSGDFPFARVHGKAALGIDDGKSRAVIPSILKSVKSFDEDGISFPLSHIAYNSAHDFFL